MADKDDPEAAKKALEAAQTVLVKGLDPSVTSPKFGADQDENEIGWPAVAWEADSKPGVETKFHSDPRAEVGAE